MALVDIVAQARERGLSDAKIRELLRPARPVYKMTIYPGMARCEQCGCRSAERGKGKVGGYALCTDCQELIGEYIVSHDGSVTLDDAARARCVERYERETARRARDQARPWLRASA